jgi:pentatricopeptide repeat protein
MHPCIHRGVPLDEVSLVCAARAYGRLQPPASSPASAVEGEEGDGYWARTRQLLELAHRELCGESPSLSLLQQEGGGSELGKEAEGERVAAGRRSVLAVAHSALINLKYVDATREGGAWNGGGRERLHRDQNPQNPQNSQNLLGPDECVTELGPAALQHSRRVLDWLRDKGVAPSAQTLDAALAVVCAHGSDEHCAQLMADRSERGVQRTAFTYNTLIDRHTSTGRVKKAFAAFEEMKAAGLRPDVATYNTLLKLALRTQDLRGALAVVREMKQVGGFAGFLCALTLSARAKGRWVRLRG